MSIFLLHLMSCTTFLHHNWLSSWAWCKYRRDRRTHTYFSNIAGTMRKMLQSTLEGNVADAFCWEQWCLQSSPSMARITSKLGVTLPCWMKIYMGEVSLLHICAGVPIDGGWRSITFLSGYTVRVYTDLLCPLTGSYYVHSRDHSQSVPNFDVCFLQHRFWRPIIFGRCRCDIQHICTTPHSRASDNYVGDRFANSILGTVRVT